MLQQGPPKPNDAIDMIMQSVERVVTSEDDNGQIVQTMVPDNWSLWWKTQMVNHPIFARLAYKVCKLENLARNLKYSMCAERAAVMETQIMGYVAAIKYSIDAKSSETIRDKDNSQTNLMFLMNRQHMEVTKTFKGDMKEAGRMGFLGGNDHDDRQGN